MASDPPALRINIGPPKPAPERHELIAHLDAYGFKNNFVTLDGQRLHTKRIEISARVGHETEVKLTLTRVAVNLTALDALPTLKLEPEPEE